MPVVDCFQREIIYLFSDLDLVKVYLNNILIVSYNDERDYLNKLSIILNHVRDYNLKVKVSKCKFLQNKLVILAIKSVKMEFILKEIKLR